MRVTNPIGNPISISYRGIEYVVEANSFLDGVPADAAEYWKTMIHNFVQISGEDYVAPVAEAPMPEVVEEAPEIVEEAVVIEEVPEEVVEEVKQEVVKKGKK